MAQWSVEAVIITGIVGILAALLAVRRQIGAALSDVLRCLGWMWTGLVRSIQRTPERPDYARIHALEHDVGLCDCDTPPLSPTELLSCGHMVGLITMDHDGYHYSPDLLTTRWTT